MNWTALIIEVLFIFFVLFLYFQFVGPFLDDVFGVVSTVK